MEMYLETMQLGNFSRSTWEVTLVDSLTQKIIDVFDGVILEDEIEHYKVDGKDYDIQYNTQRREWSCSCKDYMFRKRRRGLACKHIKQMQSKKFNFLLS